MNPQLGIGERLRTLRHDRGLSQRVLAEKSGVSYAYISRIEQGQRFPSHKAVIAMAGALGVSAHFLETGDVNGLYIYVTWDELREAAGMGCDLCTRLLVEAEAEAA